MGYMHSNIKKIVSPSLDPNNHFSSWPKPFSLFVAPFPHCHHHHCNIFLFFSHSLRYRLSFPDHAFIVVVVGELSHSFLHDVTVCHTLPWNLHRLIEPATVVWTSASTPPRHHHWRPPRDCSSVDLCSIVRRCYTRSREIWNKSLVWIICFSFWIWDNLNVVDWNLHLLVLRR